MRRYGGGSGVGRSGLVVGDVNLWRDIFRLNRTADVSGIGVLILDDDRVFCRMSDSHPPFE